MLYPVIGGLAIVATLAFAARARADAAAAACPDSSLIATSDDLERVDAALVCLLNAQRESAGLPAFHTSPQLDRSASFQSADMVDNHYFAHDHPGRPALLERILWTGYFDGAITGLYAENLLNGPQTSTTPAVMVDAWMGSPDHRTNILYPRLRDIGIGVALAPPDPAFYPDRPAVVVTTDFGERAFHGPTCGRPAVLRAPTVGGARRVCATPGERLGRRRSRGGT